MRYDVELTLTQMHHFAVEAETALEAQAKAMEQLGDREPEEMVTKAEVTKGVH